MHFKYSKHEIIVGGYFKASFKYPNGLYYIAPDVKRRMRWHPTITERSRPVIYSAPASDYPSTIVISNKIETAIHYVCSV